MPAAERGSPRRWRPAARRRTRGWYPAAGTARPGPRPQHHRLVDEADQRRHDVTAGQRAALAHLLGRRDVEGPGEHRQPRPQQLLGRRAEVVTPLGGRAERLVMRQRGAAAPGRAARTRSSRRLASCSSGTARSRTVASSIASGMPSRRRHSRVDVIRLADGDSEAGDHGGRALGEQLHRVPAAGVAGPRLGHRQRGDRRVCSPGTSSGCRLVARTTTLDVSRATGSASARAGVHQVGREPGQTMKTSTAG